MAIEKHNDLASILQEKIQRQWKISQE